MPGGDGTGPNGQGSMTGRGLGNCLSYGIPALAAGAVAAFGFGRRRGWFGRGAGQGFGRGFGRGIGAGFGFGGFGANPVNPQVNKDAELNALKEQAQNIQNRISELENE